MLKQTKKATDFMAIFVPQSGTNIALSPSETEVTLVANGSTYVTSGQHVPSDVRLLVKTYA